MLVNTWKTRSLAAGAALLVAVAATAISAREAPLAAGTPVAADPSDAWLKGLTAKHRQLFDSPAPAGGIPLIHILNYYDTYNQAYGVADRDIDAVGTFYGTTTFYGLNDAAWAKYRIGEFLETKDATGAAATANPWRTAPL